MRKRKLKNIREEAFKYLSMYKRKLGSRNGITKCVTCGDWKPWKELHGGHFFHGHTYLSYLEENNVWPQCLSCNHFKSGNLIEYALFIARLLGNGEIDRLRSLRHKPWKPTREYYEQKLEEFKRKWNDLSSS